MTNKTKEELSEELLKSVTLLKTQSKIIQNQIERHKRLKESFEYMISDYDRISIAHKKHYTDSLILDSYIKYFKRSVSSFLMLILCLSGIVLTIVFFGFVSDSIIAFFITCTFGILTGYKMIPDLVKNLHYFLRYRSSYKKVKKGTFKYSE